MLSARIRSPSGLREKTSGKLMKIKFAKFVDKDPKEAEAER
jgi:hypothetical protein